MIISLGDSHSCYTFVNVLAMKQISPHTSFYELQLQHNGQNIPVQLNCNWLGPLTMHRIGRDGFDFDKYITSEEDLLFLFFGEIDVRVHVCKQMARHRSLANIVATLANNYINSVLKNAKKTQMIICLVIPPGKNIHTGNDFGDDRDRVMATFLLNENLKWLCGVHGLKFVDLYADYACTEQMLNNDLADSINHTHVGVTNYSLNRLLGFLLTERPAVLTEKTNIT